MKHKFLSLALLATVFSFAFSSCGEDKPDIPDTPTKEDNYYTINGEKHEIKFAAMGWYAYFPNMYTALLFSTKDSNDPDFMKEENLIKLEIRDNFLGLVKEGETDELFKKFEFVVIGSDINTIFKKDVEGLEFDYSFKKVGINPQGIDVYEIKFNATIGKGKKDEKVVEFRYKGTLKTGGTGNVYNDDLSTYTEGGKINKPEPEPINNYIQFEITPKENMSEATYPFFIEGSNMFLDRNLNGKKDSGEEISDNFDGDLTVPMKDGKALFVLRGDVKKFEFKYIINNEIYYKHPNYKKIKESKLDASKCATLEKIETYFFSLTSINLSGCKALKKIKVDKNKLKTIDLKGLDNLEHINASYNEELSGKYDFSSFSKLTFIDFSATYISGVVLPNSKSCVDLRLQDTPIESVDFSKGENIETFMYGSKVSTSLDITPLNKIRNLNLYGSNVLTKLIDKSPEKKVDLYSINLNNALELKEYDLSKYKRLEIVAASYYIGVDVNTLISRLPSRKGKAEGTLQLRNTDAEKVKNSQVLKDKNWKVEVRE